MVIISIQVIFTQEISATRQNIILAFNKIITWLIYCYLLDKNENFLTQKARKTDIFSELVFVYTISIFCSRYTHDLGSTWELGSGFATSFYLYRSPRKSKLKVKSILFQLLTFI